MFTNDAHLNTKETIWNFIIRGQPVILMFQGTVPEQLEFEEVILPFRCLFVSMARVACTELFSPTRMRQILVFKWNKWFKN